MFNIYLYFQEVFEGIAKGGVFVDIDEETSRSLYAFYDEMSPESLQNMSEIIFERIVMRFSESGTSGDEEAIDYTTLRYNS